MLEEAEMCVTRLLITPTLPSGGKSEWKSLVLYFLCLSSSSLLSSSCERPLVEKQEVHPKTVWLYVATHCQCALWEMSYLIDNKINRPFKLSRATLNSVGAHIWPASLEVDTCVK